MNKPGFDKVLLENIGLETSFCSWLLYFEMIGQQEAKKLRIEKGWISASCDDRNFDKSYFKTLILGRNLAFTLNVQVDLP